MSLFNKHQIMVESTVQRSTSNQKQVKLLSNSMSGVRITSQRYTPTFEPTEPKKKKGRTEKKGQEKRQKNTKKTSEKKDTQKGTKQGKTKKITGKINCNKWNE